MFFRFADKSQVEKEEWTASQACQLVMVANLGTFLAPNTTGKQIQEATPRKERFFPVSSSSRVLTSLSLRGSS